MEYARAEIEILKYRAVLPKHAHYMVYALTRGRDDAVKIRPGSLTVESGDQVTWINLVNDKIQIVLFKGNLVFERFPDESSNYAFDLAPGGYRTFVVKNKSVAREYSYQVYCPRRQRFAEANSDPRIIVL
jgi:plastocyanin